MAEDKIRGMLLIGLEGGVPQGCPAVQKALTKKGQPYLSSEKFMNKAFIMSSLLFIISLFKRVN